MDFGYAIIKGILQGLTEFLPVSSTAHLIFIDTLAKMFGWHETPIPTTVEEFYDIMLHIGTLMAVLYYFRGDLWQIYLACTGKAASADVPNPTPALEMKKVPVFLIVSMVITVGFILTMLKGSELIMTKIQWPEAHVHDIHEFYMAHPQFVAFHLMITGCLLFYTEVASQKRTENVKHFGMKNASIIGFAQGCAGIFHGISRSGSTISAGLISGLDRLTATRYSFMLSIPTFLMAAVYESLKLAKSGLAEDLNWPAMIVGTLFSAVVGYACVKYFIQFVARNSLKGFAIYCWVIGIAMFVMINMTGKF